MIKIRVEPEFQGPGLLDIIDLLNDTEPIEVHWTNTKTEIQRLTPLRRRSVTLVVDDLATMERTASSVGARLVFEPGIISRGALALSDPSVSGWRVLVNEVGVPASRGVLVAIADRALSLGLAARPFRSVLYECMFSDVSPIDLDILLGLKTL